MGCCDPWPMSGGGGGGGGIGADKGGIYTGGQTLYVDPQHPGAVDDLDVTTPFVTIQQAITAAVADGANNATDPRQILIAAGIYTEDVGLVDGITLVGLGAEYRGGAAGFSGATASPVLIRGTVTGTFGGVAQRAQTANLRVLAQVPGQSGLYLTGAGSGVFGSHNCQFIGNAAPGVYSDAGINGAFVGGSALAGVAARAVHLTGGGIWYFTSALLRSPSPTTGVALDVGGADIVHLVDSTVVGNIAGSGTVYVYGGQLMGADPSDGIGVGQPVVTTTATGVIYLSDPTIITGADPCIDGEGTVHITHLAKNHLGGQVEATMGVNLHPVLDGALGVGRCVPSEGGVFAQQTHVGDIREAFVRATGRVRTADATPTAVDLVAGGGGWTIPDESAYWVMLRVVAIGVGGMRNFVHESRALAMRYGAGVSLGASSPSDVLYDDNGAGAGYSAVITASGNTVVPVVTGDAGMALDWVVTMELQGVVETT